MTQSKELKQVRDALVETLYWAGYKAESDERHEIMMAVRDKAKEALATLDRLSAPVGVNNCTRADLAPAPSPVGDVLPDAIEVLLDYSKLSKETCSCLRESIVGYFANQKIVPTEPTGFMIIQGANQFDGEKVAQGTAVMAKKIYEAMLSAAPPTIAPAPKADTPTPPTAALEVDAIQTIIDQYFEEVLKNKSYNGRTSRGATWAKANDQLNAVRALRNTETNK